MTEALALMEAIDHLIQMRIAHHENQVGPFAQILWEARTNLATAIQEAMEPKGKP